MKRNIYRKIIITSLGLITLICLLGYIYFQINGKSKTIEGEVIEIRKKYILVTSNKEKDYLLETKTSFEKGEIIEVEITNIKKKDNWIEGKIKKVKKITPPEEKVETSKELVTENTSTTQSNTNSEEKLETETKNETVLTTEDIITYFEEEDTLLTNYKEDISLKQKIKDSFVIIVDFLFYDGTIQGKKFKDLSNTAKLKVLKLFFFIDDKIEKYLDITVKVCENKEETCNSAKTDFKELKEKFKITWDMIKNISATGLSKLKNWYEIYRDTK